MNAHSIPPSSIGLGHLDAHDVRSSAAPDMQTEQPGGVVVPDTEARTESAKRSGYSGYSSPGCICPRCNGSAYRIPRRLVDLLMSIFVSVNRYRCRSDNCGWEGNLRVKRYPLLTQGPW